VDDALRGGVEDADRAQRPQQPDQLRGRYAGRSGERLHGHRLVPDEVSQAGLEDDTDRLGDHVPADQLEEACAWVLHDPGRYAWRQSAGSARRTARVRR